MKRFNQAKKYGAKLATGSAMLLISGMAWAAEDTTVTGAISQPIADAGDTAKAVALLVITAMVVVMAVTWAMGMLRKRA